MLELRKSQKRRLNFLIFLKKIGCIPIPQNMNLKSLTQFAKLKYVKGGVKEMKSVFLVILSYF